MVNNCDKCFKKLKDDDEVFEINDEYVCMDCMENANTQAELLCEDR